MRWAATTLLAWSVCLAGCRHSDLVEAELRTKENELREARGELLKSEAFNEALERELHAVHSEPSGVITPNSARSFIRSRKSCSAGRPAATTTTIAPATRPCKSCSSLGTWTATRSKRRIAACRSPRNYLRRLEDSSLRLGRASRSAPQDVAKWIVGNRLLRRSTMEELAYEYEAASHRALYLSRQPRL